MKKEIVLKLCLNGGQQNVQVDNKMPKKELSGQ